MNDLLSRLRSGAIVLENLPEAYNSPMLAIDDTEAEAIAKDIDLAVSEIATLTEQNAKLMEALKHCHEVFVKYEINRIDGDEISDKAISIIMVALTPQTENREGKG